MVESITELRKMCQKPTPAVDIRRRITSRPSIYLTKLLLYTPITANQVSFLTMVISILAGFFFVFDNYWFLLIGAFLMQLALILDANDGEIARYRNSASLNGQFVDIIAHSVAMPIALMGITIRFADNTLYLVLGMSAIIFVFLSATVSILKHEIVLHNLITYTKQNKPYTSSQSSTGQGMNFTQSKIKQLIKKLFLLFKYPYIMFIMSILAVFNRIEWVLIVLGIVSPILWALYAYKEFKVGLGPYEFLFKSSKS
jgi:phosphatidylglycerophosphate synthase